MKSVTWLFFTAVSFATTCVIGPCNATDFYQSGEGGQDNLHWKNHKSIIASLGWLKGSINQEQEFWVARTERKQYWLIDVIDHNTLPQKPSLILSQEEILLNTSALDRNGYDQQDQGNWGTYRQYANFFTSETEAFTQAQFDIIEADCGVNFETIKPLLEQLRRGNLLDNFYDFEDDRPMAR